MFSLFIGLKGFSKIFFSIFIWIFSYLNPNLIFLVLLSNLIKLFLLIKNIPVLLNIFISSLKYELNILFFLFFIIKLFELFNLYFTSFFLLIGFISTLFIFISSISSDFIITVSSLL